LLNSSNFSIYRGGFVNNPVTVSRVDACLIDFSGMKALVLLAHGTEEMEAVITCDILARAGITVVRAAVESEKEHDSILHCSNGMKIVADVRIEDIMENLSDFSIIVLPGGSKGASTFCSVNQILILS
jgi:putative intracellular protease/amidase